MCTKQEEYIQNNRRTHISEQDATCLKVVQRTWSECVSDLSIKVDQGL